MTARAMLDGIKVLDLSRVLAGPFCTQNLADLGATVWKIEPPWGDETRHWGPPFVDGQSTYFLAANRGKQSLGIDLKSDEGRRIVRELALQADVLVENFKPGDLARYGLAWDDLADDNPGLVYVSISGFGQGGPRSHEPGYDLLLQAATGVMASTGEPGRPPVKVGVALVDVMVGMMATNAVLGGLLERSHSGLGQHADLSLFDVGLMAMVNVAQSYLLTGDVPAPIGSGHPQIVPYQAFEAADGWIVIAVGNDEQFARFAKAAGAAELAEDERFATNRERVRHRDELLETLVPTIRTRACDEWLEQFRAAGVPAGPINDVGEAFRDPQAAARDAVWSVDHESLGETPLVANALRHLSRTPARASSGPPLLGQHTAAVLREVLGLDDGEIRRLAALSAVTAPGVTD